MITTQLLRPESIVVVGASNNVHKPGGAILKNLISGGYRGELRAINPKEAEVQGIPSFADVKDVPDTNLAILAIPAALCPDGLRLWHVKNRPVHLLFFLQVLAKKRMKVPCLRSEFLKR